MKKIKQTFLSVARCDCDARRTQNLNHAKFSVRVKMRNDEFLEHRAWTCDTLKKSAWSALALLRRPRPSNPLSSVKKGLSEADVR